MPGVPMVPQHAIRDGNWKLITSLSDDRVADALYDLKADPRERRNLARELLETVSASCGPGSRSCPRRASKPRPMAEEDRGDPRRAPRGARLPLQPLHRRGARPRPRASARPRPCGRARRRRRGGRLARAWRRRPLVRTPPPAPSRELIELTSTSTTGSRTGRCGSTATSTPLQLFDLPAGADDLPRVPPPRLPPAGRLVHARRAFRARPASSSVCSSAPPSSAPSPSRPPPVELLGYGVHHVLRARFNIERAQYWQAEYWISQTRALCARARLSPAPRAPCTLRPRLRRPPARGARRAGGSARPVARPRGAAARASG